MAINFLRGPRWYAALAVAGTVVVALWWALSGGPGYVLQIDYQFTGDMVYGAQVLVDDSIVGTLDGMPGRPLVGFKLEAGEHTVELRAERCTARPHTVTLGPSRIEVLVLDFDDSGSGCRVFFR